MNEAEATKTAKERIEKAAKNFCPLIQSACRKDCVSFKPVVVHKYLSKTEYYVRGGYCDAYFLTGPEDVY